MNLGVIPESSLNRASHYFPFLTRCSSSWCSAPPLVLLLKDLVPNSLAAPIWLLWDETAAQQRTRNCWQWKTHIYCNLALLFSIEVGMS